MHITHVIQFHLRNNIVNCYKIDAIVMHAILYHLEYLAADRTGD